ncbi:MULTISPECIES: hypothetical protein [Sporosarcina]|uniref:hypothetical protein n=1 Tax=Sporosarcina TaxID=1569 RepID=UPI00129A6EFA|nr:MULTISPECIES: hypothetical protein [Sporosarcina]GKV65814.1 hypothetical protein NCCP2331_19670 [Sporosarcina sp. NCCP-2331]GLB55938.1 hypothetical protein NCCP2378_17250 [Sporosarcina sp. NCCP-2378]
MIQDLSHSTYITLYDYENVDVVFRFMNGNLNEIKVTMKRDSSYAHPNARVILGTSTYQIFSENSGLRVERYNFIGNYKEEFWCKDLIMEHPEDFAGSNLFLTNCDSDQYRIFLGIAA